jgi:hypothetical protein
MFDLANGRLLARRSKKYWVAALCAASFACGHYLFGADDDENESLLSQYQQATQQLVTEVQPQGTRRPASASNTNPHTSRPQPVKAQAAGVATADQSVLLKAPAPQQKSSRRIKPSQDPTPDSTLAKTEQPERAETPTTEQLPANEQLAGKAVEIAQQAPSVPPAAQTPPMASENKPLPMVTWVPPQSAPTQRQLAPRMEIITPATSADPSPRSQVFAAQITPFDAAKPVPMQAEVRSPATPQNTQPVPQIITVSLPAAAPPQPTKLATSLAELNDENLPPIVSPDQVPRPGTRKKPIPQAAQAAPVLRIDLGKK